MGIPYWVKLERRFNENIEKHCRYERTFESLTDGVTKHGQAVTWNHRETDKYVVTGIDRAGKRFKRVYGNWNQARAINVWRGTKWLERDGKRVKLQSINN